MIKNFIKKNIWLVIVISLEILFLAGVVFWQHNFSEKEYRIGFFTDVHSVASKKNNYDLNDLRKKFFADLALQMNDGFRPDLMVAGGDFILGSEREGERSIRDFSKAKQYYEKIKSPLLYVIGNHETRGFSKEEWQNLTGNKKSYYYVDKNKLRVIVLDGNEKKENSQKNQKNSYNFSEEQLGWLEKTLRDSEDFYYKIIFIHFLVLDIPDIPEEKKINTEDLKRINEIFKKYEVNAVFSGHAEYLRFEEIDNIRYFILPGIDKSREKSIQWLSCFYEIYIGKEIKVKMFYKKNKEESEYRELIIPSEEYKKIEK